MAAPVPRVGEVTELLIHWQEKDGPERLFNAIYPELKRIAEGRMRRERPDHTLQPTALVNEVFVHLVDQDRVSWRSRTHFLAVASRAMRRILVDHARNRKAQKRWGGLAGVPIDETDVAQKPDQFDVVMIHELLEQLAEQDARMAQVVELRYFGGLTHEETAEVLGVDERTAKRDWQVARAWLFQRLGSSPP